MRRKLLTLDNISNNQKINQIFSHEVNINKKIKKVTSLDTQLENLSEVLPGSNNNDMLSVIGNFRQYRFKYIFIPPRGSHITVNSANLMNIGFLYSVKEEYEKYFQNPNYSLLIYTPLFKEYYFKVSQVIYANTFDKYPPIISFSINHLQQEFPLIKGEISNIYKDVNYTIMKEYYIEHQFEDDIKKQYWNISPYRLKSKLKDKDLLSRLFKTYYANNSYNKRFKCKYLWQDVDKKQYVIINENNIKDNKLMKQIQEKMQLKIDILLNTLASAILIHKLL